MANGRESTGGFRVGKYVVRQVPLNVSVCELRLVATGEDSGMEVEAKPTKTFHKNWEDALNNLYDRLMVDNCSDSTRDSINSVKASIVKSREMILEAISKQGLK